MLDNLSAAERTETDSMHQEKKEEDDLLALKIALM